MDVWESRNWCVESQGPVRHDRVTATYRTW